MASSDKKSKLLNDWPSVAIDIGTFKVFVRKKTAFKKIRQMTVFFFSSTYSSKLMPLTLINQTKNTVNYLYVEISVLNIMLTFMMSKKNP